MGLTDIACKNAKPREKAYKLAAGGGLYLLVHPNGGRYWRWKFRIFGKEKLLAIGTYPRVPLSAAKDARDEARRKLDAGVDPAIAKRIDKDARKERAANTFEGVAREWHGARSGEWSALHAQKILRSLEINVFPMIGDRPIAELKASEILRVVRQVEQRDALDVAGRILQRIGSVMRYAVVTERAERNPAADLRGALKSPERQNRRALPAEDLPAFLRGLRTYRGSEVTRLAMHLLILTFVRSGELRGAMWSEFDIDEGMWRIPAERMKMKEEHLVPLSTQAVADLRELRAISGHRPHVFPNVATPSKIMSENTLLRCIELLGFRDKATAHGFRTTASTWLNEAGFHADVIERQLAHAPRDKVRSAYNKAQWLPARVKMMQTWGDTIEAMEQGAKVTPLRRSAAA